MTALEKANEDCLAVLRREAEKDAAILEALELLRTNADRYLIEAVLLGAQAGEQPTNGS